MAIIIIIAANKNKLNTPIFLIRFAILSIRFGFNSPMA